MTQIENYNKNFYSKLYGRKNIQNNKNNKKSQSVLQDLQNLFHINSFNKNDKRNDFNEILNEAQTFFTERNASKQWIEKCLAAKKECEVESNNEITGGSSLKRLSRNVSWFGKVFPRGMQKAFSLGFIYEQKLDAFDNVTGIFKFVEFCSWMKKIIGEENAKNYLDEKYYKHIRILDYECKGKYPQMICFGNAHYTNRCLLTTKGIIPIVFNSKINGHLSDEEDQNIQKDGINKRQSKRDFHRQSLVIKNKDTVKPVNYNPSDMQRFNELTNNEYFSYMQQSLFSIIFTNQSISADVKKYRDQKIFLLQFFDLKKIDKSKYSITSYMYDENHNTITAIDANHYIQSDAQIDYYYYELIIYNLSNEKEFIYETSFSYSPYQLDQKLIELFGTKEINLNLSKFFRHE